MRETLEGDEMNTATSKTRCPTIAEIARRNEQAGGHYFDPGTLRFFGQTRGDFKAKRIGGRVIVYAFTHNGWNIGFSGRPSSLAEFDEKTGNMRTPADADELKERFRRDKTTTA